MKKLLSFMTIATLLVSCNLEFKSLESAIEDFENDGDYTNVQVSEIEHFNTLAGAVGGTKVDHVDPRLRRGYSELSGEHFPLEP
jgi:hypothetical protein